MPEVAFKGTRTGELEALMVLPDSTSKTWTALAVSRLALQTAGEHFSAEKKKSDPGG